MREDVRREKEHEVHIHRVNLNIVIVVLIFISFKLMKIKTMQGGAEDDSIRRGTNFEGQCQRHDFGLKEN